MSFIGNSFTNQTFVPQVDYFNGNASATAFTLSRNVASVADVQVVIENVPQNPASAFTVSGNVITFTSAPPSGTNNIYVRYTSPTTNVIKPAQGTVGPTEINSSYSLWNLSGSTISYSAGNVGIGNTTASSFAGALNLALGTGSSGSALTLYTGTSSTGAVYFADGSTSSDRYRGAIEYTHSNDAMLFTTGASERMRITSTGFVGVGTISPYKRLSVTQASSTAYSTTDFDRDYLAVQIANTTDDKATGIYFAVGSNGEAAISAVETSDGETALTFGTRGGGVRPERMRILGDGSILLGTSTQGGATGISFSNASDSAAYGKSMYMNSPYNGTRNAISFAYNSAGGVGQIVTGTNSVSYQSGSDYRLKENIAPMTGALTTVAQLKPVTFNWKSDGSDGQGFIAHELQAVVPDCVTGEKDAVDADGKPVYQGVDTSFLVATLTAAIQEQQAIIENLKSRIEVLEAK